jgi:dihydrolipoamide dehydrogenase
MGRGRLKGATTVEVTPNDGGSTFDLTTKDVIINTGSRPRPIAGVPYDGVRVINSDHAVVLEDLPKSFIIRGGAPPEWNGQASITGMVPRSRS